MNFSFRLENVASWDEVQQKKDQIAEQQLDRMEQQANDPEVTKRHEEEMKQLVAEKKYKFLSTFQDANGATQYVYSFTSRTAQARAEISHFRWKT